MAALSLFLAHAAAAQTPNNPEQRVTGNYEASQSEAQNSQAIRDELHKKLEDAGFTEIEMVPSRFLVRAKDQNGHPVMLVINLDSGDDQEGTVGEGSNNQ
jgi:hypothetical protein